MRHASSNVFLHLLILVFSLSITLGVRSASKERYAQERRQIEAIARAKRSLEISAKWNAVPYIDISIPGVAEKILSKFDSQKLALTEFQYERFRIRLKNVLDYLHDPTFEGYLHLKTNGLHYSFTAIAQAQQLFPDENPPALSDAERVSRMLWNGAARTNVDFFPRLNAICLERIRAAIVHTNSPGSVFNGPVAQGFTMAHAAARSGFRYGTGSNDTESVASYGP